MDKKIKLVFPPDLYRAAKAKADQSGQTLEEWLMAIVHQQLESSETIPPLDWGRIDSRIDQRTIFLERRLDVLSERLDQLCKHLPAESLPTHAPNSDQMNFKPDFCCEDTPKESAASTPRLTA
jgi:hypothetical protein